MWKTGMHMLVLLQVYVECQKIVSKAVSNYDTTLRTEYEGRTNAMPMRQVLIVEV